MTSINIKRQLDMTQQQAREAADRVAQKLEQEYGVAFTWDGDHAKIAGPGVKGSCAVVDGGVDIRLTLGFLVAAFAGRVENEINKYFDKLEAG